MNPRLNLLLSVSPVMHLKDGWQGNEVSKSHLVLMCNELSKSVDEVIYVPVYEYVTRFLRSYDYFESDGMHPNQKAVAKIYDWLKTSLFTSEFDAVVETWQPLKQDLAHRSLKPLSDSNYKFKSQLLQNLIKFGSDHQIDLAVFIANLEAEIADLTAQRNILSN